MRLQRGEEEEEEEAAALTGGDKETSGVRRVLAPEDYRSLRTRSEDLFKQV